MKNSNLGLFAHSRKKVWVPVTYTSNGTFIVPTNVYSIDVLIVAGGGGTGSISKVANTGNGGDAAYANAVATAGASGIVIVSYLL